MIKKFLNVVLFVFLFIMGFLVLPYGPGWASILAAVFVLPSKKFQVMLDGLFRSHKMKQVIVTLAVIVLFCVYLNFIAEHGLNADNFWVYKIAYALGRVSGYIGYIFG